MKRIRIVQAVLLLAVAAVMASCSSSRRNTYGKPYPPGQTHFSLIIHPSPGIAVNRYYDGRYFYRSPQGYIYWRGYDNRYYLDRQYIRRSYYNHRQYNDWKYGHNRYYRKNHRR